MTIQTYQDGLEQIKKEEVTRVSGTFNRGFYRDREWAENDVWQYERARVRRREQAEQIKIEAERIKNLSVHERYKVFEVPKTIKRYREESKYYRNVHNFFQAIIIIGSVLVTGLIGFGDIPKWIPIIFSILVSISAGFTGYFKFRERSFNLQQTADNIEQEYIAANLGIGVYKNSSSDNDLLILFAERVERLKEEQKKRQQQLEQPPDAKDGKT